MKCSDLDIIKDHDKYFACLDTHRGPNVGYIITPVRKETLCREDFIGNIDSETKYVFYVIQQYEVGGKEESVKPVEQKNDILELEEDCDIYEVMKWHLLSKESIYYIMYGLRDFYWTDSHARTLYENLEFYLGNDWDK